MYLKGHLQSLYTGSCWCVAEVNILEDNVLAIAHGQVYFYRYRQRQQGITSMITTTVTATNGEDCESRQIDHKLSQKLRLPLGTAH